EHADGLHDHVVIGQPAGLRRAGGRTVIGLLQVRELLIVGVGRRLAGRRAVARGRLAAPRTLAGLRRLPGRSDRIGSGGSALTEVRAVGEIGVAPRLSWS